MFYDFVERLVGSAIQNYEYITYQFAGFTFLIFIAIILLSIFGILFAVYNNFMR